MLRSALRALILLPLCLSPAMRYEFERLYERGPVAIVAPAPISAPALTPLHFASPTGRAIVSGWYFMDLRFPADGPQHTGVDLACFEGEPIRAGADGVVEFAARNGDCGLEVAVRHASGYVSYYCHLSGFASSGWVQRGDVVGFCGNTGLSTGAHLHYEVRRWGVPVDPLGLP